MDFFQGLIQLQTTNESALKSQCESRFMRTQSCLLVCKVGRETFPIIALYCRQSAIQYFKPREKHLQLARQDHLTNHLEFTRFTIYQVTRFFRVTTYRVFLYSEPILPNFSFRASNDMYTKTTLLVPDATHFVSQRFVHWNQSASIW